jgi:hypothetical protein
LDGPDRKNAQQDSIIINPQLLVYNSEVNWNISNSNSMASVLTNIEKQTGALPDDDPSLFGTATPMEEEPEEEKFVVKKDGSREPVDFRQIIEKIERLSQGLPHVEKNHHEISQQVIANFTSGCTTYDLDIQAMKAAMNHPTHHQGYKTLACRIFVDDLHRRTPKKFSLAMKELFEWGTLSDEYYAFVKENAEELDKIVVDALDNDFNFMSLCTWAHSYLLKVGGRVVERPQYAFLREAIGVTYPMLRTNEDPSKKRKVQDPVPTTKMTPEILARIRRRYYQLAVAKEYVLASPTKFNIGTKCNQLSSCFLSQIKGDSVDGIYDTLKDDAKISQSGGGIGNHVSNIRAAGSRIVTTNGKSNGLVPMLKVRTAIPETSLIFPPKGLQRHGPLHGSMLHAWDDHLHGEWSKGNRTHCPRKPCFDCRWFLSGCRTNSTTRRREASHFYSTQACYRPC